VRHAYDLRRAKRLKPRGAVGLHHRIQVRHVTGNVDSRNLPHAIGVLAEATDEPGHEEAGVVDVLAEFDNIMVGDVSLSMSGQLEDCLLFGSGEDRATGQPVKETLKLRLSRCRHVFSNRL
jgi:hypothetical protein